MAMGVRSPPDPKVVFREELLKREEIVWFGQPDPSVIFSKADILIVPFSFLWAGFAFFAFGFILVATILASPAALIALIIAGPMAVVGLYITIGRFFYKKWIKRRTHYAVTDHRVLALTLGLTRRLEALELNSIPAISRSIHPDGTGTLWFGNAPWWLMLFGNSSMELLAPSGSVPVVFYDIRDAARVYELVNRMREDE